MYEIIKAFANLNIISLLFILFLSVLGLYGICKKLRNERNKKVECIDIMNIKQIKVRNRFAYLIPVSFWKKHISSNRFIDYIEHERIVTIAGVISDEEIEDARLKNKIFKFLKENVKGHNIKVNYRFKKKLDLGFWKRIWENLKSENKLFVKFKNLFKVWFVKYDYYFDIYYINENKRKTGLNSDMILRFKTYTKNESLTQMFKYRKVVDEVKYNKKDEEKTDVEKKVSLKPVWKNEIENEHLENL